MKISFYIYFKHRNLASLKHCKILVLMGTFYLEHIIETPCSETDIKYHRPCQMAPHVRKEQTTYTCNQCNASFSNIKEKLKHHINTHSYRCVKCYKVFVSKSTRMPVRKKGCIGIPLDKVHMHTLVKSMYFQPRRTKPHKTHTYKRSYKCSQCKKIFTSYDGRLRHCTIFHKKQIPYPTCAGRKLHKCSECYKYFHSYRGKLQHQTKAHNRMMSYYCIECDKVFACKSELSAHMQNKPYQCIVCNKMFLKYILLPDQSFHDRSLCVLCLMSGCDSRPNVRMSDTSIDTTSSSLHKTG